jgi:hypothetical protein
LIAGKQNDVASTEGIRPVGLDDLHFSPDYPYECMLFEDGLTTIIFLADAGEENVRAGIYWVLCYQ